MTHDRIEVDFSTDDLEINHPKCRHGPTLLFRSSDQRFFACSACRDRQECQIYIPYDQRKKKSMQKNIEHHQREYQLFRKHVRQIQKKKKRLEKNRKCFYCYTCSILFFESEQSDHEHHQCTNRLTRRQFRHPCQSILQPLEKKRSDAQYFFSSTLIDYLIEKIIQPGPWDSVLCIGCPTIFEHLRHQSQRRSYLLDYDVRLCSFYSSKQMLVYNMFNGHIFSRSKSFEAQFLSATKHCLILIDPPFGGFHRALAHSLEKLFESHSHIERHLILFNPYFLEKWISDAFPRLQMLDHKVEYMSSMNLCRGRKGSPVRMFTDLDRSIFPPLDDQNYKFCFECNRYTLLTNQHCYQCQSCTSKDGLPYRHCSKCQRCVKAEREHCSKCHVCHLPNQCRK